MQIRKQKILSASETKGLKGILHQMSSKKFGKIKLQRKQILLLTEISMRNNCTEIRATSK